MKVSGRFPAGCWCVVGGWVGGCGSCSDSCGVYCGSDAASRPLSYYACVFLRIKPKDSSSQRSAVVFIE